MVDFAKIRSTLEQSQQRLTQQRGAAQNEEILRRRMRALAEREDDDVEDREVYRTVVVVTRDRSTYGLPIESVQEVRRVNVTRLPYATDVVQGIFHVRGRVHSLIDLAAITGSARRPGHGDSVLVAILENDRDTLGVRIDEVVQPRTVHQDELDDDAAIDEDGIITAITGDMVEIVDPVKLFHRSDIVLRI